MMTLIKKAKPMCSPGRLLAVALVATALAPPVARAGDQITLKVAYASDFEPATPDLGKAWWNDVISQFQVMHRL